MKSNNKILNDYDIFGSSERGNEENDKRAEKLLYEKETEENLILFAKRIGSDWKATASGESSRLLSFSDFEKAIAHKKQDIAKFLENDRNARGENQ